MCDPHSTRHTTHPSSEVYSTSYIVVLTKSPRSKPEIVSADNLKENRYLPSNPVGQTSECKPPRLLWCHRLHRSPNASSILVAQSQRVPFIARLQPLPPHWSVPGAIRRQMDYASTRKASVPHLVRTAAEPRQNRMYTVRLSHIDEVNPTVRLIQLTIPPSCAEFGGAGRAS